MMITSHVLISQGINNSLRGLIVHRSYYVVNVFIRPAPTTYNGSKQQTLQMNTVHHITIAHVSNIFRMQFLILISRNTQSKQYLCYHRLCVPGISKMMHHVILINTPYRMFHQQPKAPRRPPKSTVHETFQQCQISAVRKVLFCILHIVWNYKEPKKEWGWEMLDS